MNPASVSPRTLSVVVAAWHSPESLGRCVAALGTQLRPEEDELIVARNFVGPALGGDARDLALDPETNVPRLRAAGLAAASGRIIAFLEDDTVPLPGWREALVQAFVPPMGVVGGPVELAPGGRALDWAVYFYDYARFAPPMASGPVTSLSGANVAYAKEAIARATPDLSAGLHEAALETELIRLGVPMWLQGNAAVAIAPRERAAHAIGLAFALARGYMGRRLAHAPLPRRLARAGIAPLVPLVLFVRVARAVRRSPRLAGRFVRSAGWVLLLQLAWGAGEGVGALLGAGRADDRWR